MTTPKINAGCELLISWYRKCSVYKNFHDEAFEYCKFYDEAITIPIIITNTIAGSLSFISLSFSAEIVFWTTLAVGILTIISSMLSGFKDYYTWKEQAIHHQEASKGYLKLRNMILMLMAKHKMGQGASYGEIVSEVGKLLSKINNDAPEFPKYLRKQSQEILDEFTVGHIELLSTDTVYCDDTTTHYDDGDVIDKYSNMGTPAPVNSSNKPFTFDDMTGGSRPTSKNPSPQSSMSDENEMITSDHKQSTDISCNDTASEIIKNLHELYGLDDKILREKQAGEKDKQIFLDGENFIENKETSTNFSLNSRSSEQDINEMYRDAGVLRSDISAEGIILSRRLSHKKINEQKQGNDDKV
jgi:hypothetical protein